MFWVGWFGFFWGCRIMFGFFSCFGVELDFLFSLGAFCFVQV